MSARFDPARPRTLVVFCRAPQVGAVKTRLARGIGRLAAWRFYRGALRGVLREAPDPRWRLRLAVTPDRDGGRHRLFPAGAGRRPQGRGDLGARMARAMRAAGPGPVVLVGADIPGLRRRHLAAAFRALETAEAVFGPANDGGYWLVGLRRPGHAAALFANVRWSSAHALADTRANLPRAARAVLLEELVDVDTAADLAVVRQRR